MDALPFNTSVGRPFAELLPPRPAAKGDGISNAREKVEHPLLPYARKARNAAKLGRSVLTNWNRFGRFSPERVKSTAASLRLVEHSLLARCSVTHLP